MLEMTLNQVRLIHPGLNNYLCGTTNMKLWEFALGTFIGILPGMSSASSPVSHNIRAHLLLGTTAYCYIGATGKVVSAGISGLQTTLFVCGIAAALYLVYFLNQLATETLRKAGVH